MPAPQPKVLPLSLSGRLVTGMAVLLILGGIVVSFAAYAYGRAAAREAFDRLLLGAANDIAESVSVIDGAPVADLPVSAFALLALAADDRIAYQIRGPQGDVLTGYEALPLPPPKSTDTVLYDARFSDEPARFIRVVRRFAERRFSGPVEIIVGQTMFARNELAYSITRNALIGLAMGGVLMLAFAAFVVRRSLRPLDRLAATLSARDPQDLTPMDARVPREVDVMVLAINGFMGRLDNQFQTMKTLISDTAHQLRTPVAALRAQADLLEDESNPQTRDQIVSRMHRGTVRLSHLLEQMLARALVIHRGDAARRELIDLRDIALEVFEESEHPLLASDVDVHLDIGDAPVLVRGDSIALSEALKNLLRNAVFHGGSPVTIRVTACHEFARLTVLHTGPGPSPEVRAFCGKRFNSSAALGTGLGLAIAQSVATAFGGRLQLENTSEGFEISILLPQENIK